MRKSVESSFRSELPVGARNWLKESTNLISRSILPKGHQRALRDTTESQFLTNSASLSFPSKGRTLPPTTSDPCRRQWIERNSGLMTLYNLKKLSRAKRWLLNLRPLSAASWVRFFVHVPSMDHCKGRPETAEKALQRGILLHQRISFPASNCKASTLNFQSAAPTLGHLWQKGACFPPICRKKSLHPRDACSFASKITQGQFFQEKSVVALPVSTPIGAWQRRSQVDPISCQVCFQQGLATIVASNRQLR